MGSCPQDQVIDLSPEVIYADLYHTVEEYLKEKEEIQKKLSKVSLHEHSSHLPKENQISPKHFEKKGSGQQNKNKYEGNQPESRYEKREANLFSENPIREEIQMTTNSDIYESDEQEEGTKNQEDVETSFKTGKGNFETQFYPESSLTKGSINLPFNDSVSNENSDLQSFHQNLYFNDIYRAETLNNYLLGNKSLLKKNQLRASAFQEPISINPRSKESFVNFKKKINDPPYPVHEIYGPDPDPGRIISSYSRKDSYFRSESVKENFEIEVDLLRNFCKLQTDKGFFMIKKIKIPFSTAQSFQESSNTIINDLELSEDQERLQSVNKFCWKIYIGSIFKGIKTSVFNESLVNKIEQYDLFSEEIVTNVNINTDEGLIEKTNSKILEEILSKKHYDNIEAALKELQKIFNKEFFNKTFSEVYAEEYQCLQECRENLRKLVGEGKPKEYVSAYKSLVHSILLSILRMLNRIKNSQNESQEYK